MTAPFNNVQIQDLRLILLGAADHRATALVNIFPATNLLSPRNTVAIGKLVVSQLFKAFPALYGKSKDHN